MSSLLYSRRWIKHCDDILFQILSALQLNCSAIKEKKGGVIAYAGLAEKVKQKKMLRIIISGQKSSF